MEEYSVADIHHLLQAATDFAYYPGVQNEASVKEFLERFPLPVLINALQTKAEVPGLESALVACLERVFRTKYGASLIPQYMPFLQIGLQADSEAVRFLACKTVSCLFENLDDKSVLPAQLIVAYDLYPRLLDCLVKSDERVAAASMDAIKNFASSPEGVATIFPPEGNEATDLRHLTAKCSSLGRVRVLALIVKLFSVSHSLASVIYSSNLFGLLEAEVSKTDDTLTTLSILELLFELAEVEHAAEFLPKTNLLQLLSSYVRNSSADSVLRSRAMVISGRMLSRENNFTFIGETSVLEILSAIERRLESSESIDDNECESALEAVGQVGSYIGRRVFLASVTFIEALASSLTTLGIRIPEARFGAELLLLRSPGAVKFVANSAFNRQRRGKQLAALDALGNIAGVNRSENNSLLKVEAEECLRRLIYETASMSSKLTPSSLLLSVLQQESEVRLAAYRLISGLVARPWFFMEVCSKLEIIDMVTDAYMESTKIGMEARHNCCLSINQALAVSSNLRNDATLSGISAKLQEAVKRGPYLAQKNAEARPTITTEQRF